MELIDRDGTVIGGDGGLTVTPHPLLLTGQRHIPSDLIPGESLSSFLRRHEPTIDSGAWIVTINGYEVPQKMWSRTRPKHGTLVECRSVVRKEALALIAVVLIAIYAPQFGAYMATTIGGSAAAWTAATIVAGSMIVNKVLGPKPISPQQLRDNQASPTYALSGGRNRARAFEPIGLLFGEVQIAPDYASKPYTWFQGDDQYMYCVFHGGINCAQVNLITVGQTPLANYSDVYTKTAGFSDMPEETLEGWGNVDSIAGGLLPGSSTVDTTTGNPPLGLSSGAYVTRTSSDNTIALQVDIEGVAYFVQDNGSLMTDYATYYSGEYRLLPSGPWLQFFNDAIVTVVSASTKPIRRTFLREVPAGQYEVRLRKEIADVSGTREQNALSWTALKSFQADVGTYGGMGRLGLRIKASGQLSGALDEVKWLARAKSMGYWNGSAWVTATTRANGLSNPGAQFLLFARGIHDGAGKLLAGIGLSDSQIDIESLQGFMVHCTANGFTFDHYFDSAISRQDVLDAIAAVGMGSVSWQSGKLGVVWAAEDQPIEGVVNMATMKAKTFRVNYQTVETADGIEYTYFDRDRDFTWQPIRVIDPNVSVSLNPARITSIGVTTEAHAAKLARFHLAQSLFQRKDISFDTDLEHLTYKRMSVMALTHDVTQWGYGGRLHSAVNNAGILTLELDDIVPAGTSVRYIGLRIPGEKGDRIFGVNAFTGESRTITLSEAWPVGVPVPGATSDNPAMDTLWIYDFKSTPGYKVRVASIQPQANMSGATVSVVPESAEFWDYVWNGTYTAPVSQSLLHTGLPVVSRLQVTEELKRQGNTFYVELTVTFDVSGLYERAEVWGATAGNSIGRLGETRGVRFSWQGTLNDVWSIEIRPFGTLGRVGPIVSTSHSVAGLTKFPTAPSAVAVTPGLLIFTCSPDVDVDGYRVRYNHGENSNLSVATFLHDEDSLIPGSPWPMPIRLYGVNTIIVTAVDTSGNESAAAFDTQDFGVPDEANVADTVDYPSLGFPGFTTNGTVVGTDLQADLDPSADIYSTGSGADIYYRDGASDIYGGDQFLALTYIATYASPYNGGTVLLEKIVTGARMTIDYRVDGAALGDIYSGTDIYGGPVGIYGDEQQWRPWTGALNPTIADLGLQFRIITDAGSTQGVIDALSARTEMPSLEQTFGRVLINAAGTTFAPSSGIPPRNWIAIEDVQITPVVDGSGAIAGRVTQTPDPITGPIGELINSSAVAVTGYAFVRVRGY
jgi:hypothetical protein